MIIFLLSVYNTVFRKSLGGQLLVPSALAYIPLQQITSFAFKGDILYLTLMYNNNNNINF